MLCFYKLLTINSNNKAVPTRMSRLGYSGCLWQNRFVPGKCLILNL